MDSYFAMLDKGGTIGLSIFIVIAFVKGWIVPRWTYDRLEKQYERMEQVAFGSLELGTRAATVAEKKVL